MISWEDIETGTVTPFGEREVGRDEMVTFARQFDPQPHHLDEEAGKLSLFGGLVAPGWFSAAVMMRMAWDHYLLCSTSLGSPGIEELKWLRPVFPGDRLSCQFECLDKRLSVKQPGLGICDFLYEMFNQKEERVMSSRCTQFFASRKAGAPPQSQSGEVLSRKDHALPLPVFNEDQESPLIRFFEHIELDKKVKLGDFQFTPEKIKTFAATYDPQPFHLDEAAAAKSLFGGLSASGWHTASAWMRQMVDYYEIHAKRLADHQAPVPRLGPSPGFQDLKWLKPVFAGDEISYFCSAEKKKPLARGFGWGLLSVRSEGVNQKGDLVFSFLCDVLIETERGRER